MEVYCTCSIIGRQLWVPRVVLVRFSWYRVKLILYAQFEGVVGKGLTVVLYLYLVMWMEG